jgi:simple sugar transport system permease protein
MELVLFIFASSFPLIIATIAALSSEYAGRMIFFIDGLITLSAFICFAVTVKFNNFLLGIIFAIFIPALFVFIISYIVEKFNFDSFIVSLGQNIFLLSCVSVLSQIIFNNRGVLTSEVFVFSQQIFRVTSICVGFLICIIALIFFNKTKAGLYLKITGSDSNVLLSCGVSPSFYRVLSLVIASVLSSICGIILLLRLSSFVPGISSGIGWASLALVFLGKRRILCSILMALLFGISQFVASNIQSIELFKNISSGVLLSLPYLLSIFFIICIPEKK